MDTISKQILYLSYKHKLSHIGSCLTAAPIIDHIYSVKQKHEPFILSAGHAHLAHLVVMEKYKVIKSAQSMLTYGIHCDRRAGCDVSTGSLGHGIGIAVGMALADRSRNVYVLLTDGDMMEGSVWEALRIAGEQRLENLRVTINANSYGAYRPIDSEWIDLVTQLFYPSLVVKTNMFKYPSYLNGLEGHYHVLSEKEYKEVIQL